MRERWRIAILALCAAVAVCAVATFFGNGLGYLGIPRVGLWGMQQIPGKPFTFVVTSLDPEGAAVRAGIRPGDVIDVRMQPEIVRFWLVSEPIAHRPVNLQIVRGGAAANVTVVPLPLDLVHRRPDVILFYIAVLWMLAFAALLAWRKPDAYDVRLLSLVLVCLALRLTIPNIVGSSPALFIAVFVGMAALQGMTVILWALYCGCFARPPSSLRRIVQSVCIAAAAVSIAIGIAATFGESRLWFSAEGYLDLYGGRSEMWHLPGDFAVVMAIVASALAVTASRGEERLRAIWSLVPIAFLLAGSAIATYMFGAQTSYFGLFVWIALRNVVIFLAPIALTYAALGRRLLDVGFVANRALIFGVVSAIVVCVFLIVEWAANELLVNASRTTGTIFSMAVALGLGLSMRPIHRWADRFVDEVFFRKRHEDEAALRRFAHEAAFITDRATLVERAIGEVREHANAAAASILFPGADVDENDRAILAMRTWHKPVDLETLETAVPGEYAFPMISRGRLVGVLVCCAKADGESYAPDEMDALSEVAHRVGTALELLGDRREGDTQLVLEQLAALNRRIDDLTELRLPR